MKADSALILADGVLAARWAAKRMAQQFSGFRRLIHRDAMLKRR